jgi:hypothetical protein
MAHCPECKSEIGMATYCGCGWRQGVVGKAAALSYPNDPPRVYCAHESCPHLSVVKIKTNLGWANLCMKHYEEHFRVRIPA